VSEPVGEALFWPEERWRDVQARRLAEHLRRARECGLYREMSIPPGPEITGAGLAAVLQGLPFTTKDQLAAATAEQLSGADDQDVAEWVSTSGTLGKPLDVPLTRGDVERLAENEAVALSIAGVGKGDLVVLAVGMERLFVAGLAYWLGAQKRGAACVRIGPRLAERPDALRHLCGRLRGSRNQRAFVIAVPSYLLNLEPAETGLTGIIAIGEPVKRDAGDGRLEYNALGSTLSQRFGCPVMSTYAMTETCTTFAEGPACQGGHVNPELAIVEVVDDAGLPVQGGTVGEVVVTPLGVQGLPLVRFRTGDMAALYTGNCRCGRTTPRVGPIVGRRQQLLKIRGVSVYPGAILEAMQSIKGVAQCVIVAEEAGALSDRVTIFVHAPEPTTDLRRDVEGRLRAVLRVVPQVEYLSGEDLRALQLSAGRKLTRFIDRRS